MNQQRTELLFKLADLPTERRLGDMQKFCCTGEIQRFCYDLEVAKVTMLHQISQVWLQIHLILDVARASRNA